MLKRYGRVVDADIDDAAAAAAAMCFKTSLLGLSLVNDG